MRRWPAVVVFTAYTKQIDARNSPMLADHHRAAAAPRPDGGERLALDGGHDLDDHDDADGRQIMYWNASMLVGQPAGDGAEAPHEPGTDRQQRGDDRQSVLVMALTVHAVLRTAAPNARSA